jgi:hypothetical protein
MSASMSATQVRLKIEVGRECEAAKFDGAAHGVAQYPKDLLGGLDWTGSSSYKRLGEVV